VLNLVGETYRWYALPRGPTCPPIDLRFIDGPPASTGSQARYPGLPLSQERLSPRAVVVMDDLVRTDEQEAVRRWTEADWGAHRYSVLRRTQQFCVGPRGQVAGANAVS
jgi:hypothetical protein